MTTGELIELLKAVDPDGTTPVCVSNADVYTVTRLEAYYDGRLEQLVHDEAKRGKAWSVVGARLIRTGDKIAIRPLSIEEVLVENPSMPVEVSDRDRDTVERWRIEARRIRAAAGEED